MTDLLPANIICSFFIVDIPEEEARYWTYKLEQINALTDDNEVGTALFEILKDGENLSSSIDFPGRCKSILYEALQLW